MSIYINKDAIYPHPKETFRLCQLFAEKIKDLDVEVVDQLMKTGARIP
jgi:hypothetical protein